MHDTCASSILDLVVCPRCLGQLRATAPANSHAGRGGTDQQVLLDCTRCGLEFPVFSGVPCMIAPTTSSRGLLKEVAARLKDTARRSRGPLPSDPLEAQRIAEDTRTAELHRRLEQWATESLAVEAGQVVLELGVGAGGTTRRLAERGARVVATDVYPWDLARIGEEGIACGAMCEAARLPFPDHTFDVTVGRSFLHHVDEFDRAATEMARVTRRGGKVAVICEPTRAITDVEASYARGSAADILGYNERVRSFLDYYRALTRAGRVDVHCTELNVALRPACELSDEEFHLIGEQLSRVDGPVDERYLYLLNFASGWCNMVATIEHDVHRSPTRDDDSEALVCTPSEYLALVMHSDAQHAAAAAEHIERIAGLSAQPPPAAAARAAPSPDPAVASIEAAVERLALAYPDASAACRAMAEPVRRLGQRAVEAEQDMARLQRAREQDVAHLGRYVRALETELNAIRNRRLYRWGEWLVLRLARLLGTSRAH
ncbi:MAG: methyltransferase domain-containing protein [Armatimonadota bacterium]|nr:MAG: methyltransferase domain-containing protein [Armatimonadota bacterium]